MKGTCAILDGEIITSPRSLPDSTVVYQLGLPKLREIKYEVFFVDCCFFHVVLQPFKAATYFILYIFYRLICCHQTVAKRSHPYVPLQSRAFSMSLPRPTLILAGCCFDRFNCGHLRPWPHPSLSEFFSIEIRRPNRWHGVCSTHKERGKSCWVVAARDGCCVLFHWSDT